MPTSLFEGDKIKLTVKVSDASKNGKKCVVTFTKTEGGVAAALPDLTATVEGTEAKVSLTTPNVADDKDSYSLTYTWKIEGEPDPAADGTESWEVYLKTVSVEFTPVGADGKALDEGAFKTIDYQLDQGVTVATACPKCSTTVEAAKRQCSGETKKKLTLKLAAKAPAKFEVQPPFEIVKWDPQVGRNRKADVKKTYDVEVFAPKPEDADHDGSTEDKAIRQCVNERTEEKGQDGKGKVVTIEIGGKGDKDRGASDKLAKKDDELHLKLTITRDATLKAKVKGAPPGLNRSDVLDLELVPEDNAFEQTARVKVGADGVARFKLDVGEVGGDQFKLEYGATTGLGNELHLRVFRKLYYQVSIPATLDVPDLSVFRSSLEKVFILTENTKDPADPQAFEEIAENAGPASGWVVKSDVEFKKGNDPSLVVGAHNSEKMHSLMFKPPKAAAKLALHILCCDAQYDGDSAESEPGWTIKHDAIMEIPWPPPADASAYDTNTADTGPTKTKGFAMHLHERYGSGKDCVFPKALQDGKPSVRDGKWKAAGAKRTTKGPTSGSIPEDHIVVRYKQGVAGDPKGGTIFVKLPEEAGKCLTEGLDVTCSYKIKTCTGPWEGESHPKHGNWLLADANSAPAECCDTFIHELGHAISMNTADDVDLPGFDYTPEQKKSKAEKLKALRAWHGQHYKKNGDHCHSNGDTCVMFESGASGSGSVFCDPCKHVISAALITDVT